MVIDVIQLSGGVVVLHVAKSKQGDPSTRLRLGGLVHFTMEGSTATGEHGLQDEKDDRHD